MTPDNPLDQAARHFGKIADVEAAARRVVQIHARLEEAERALVASHAELDKARAGGHHKVAALCIGFAAAARRAIRYLRMIEDGAVRELRLALGLSLEPSREEIGRVISDDTPPGTADNHLQEDGPHGSTEECSTADRNPDDSSG